MKRQKIGNTKHKSASRLLFLVGSKMPDSRLHIKHFCPLRIKTLLVIVLTQEVA